MSHVSPTKFSVCLTALQTPSHTPETETPIVSLSPRESRGLSGFGKAGFGQAVLHPNKRSSLLDEKRAPPPPRELTPNEKAIITAIVKIALHFSASFSIPGSAVAVLPLSLPSYVVETAIKFLFSLTPAETQRYEREEDEGGDGTYGTHRSKRFDLKFLTHLILQELHKPPDAAMSPFCSSSSSGENECKSGCEGEQFKTTSSMIVGELIARVITLYRKFTGTLRQHIVMISYCIEDLLSFSRGWMVGGRVETDPSNRTGIQKRKTASRRIGPHPGPGVRPRRLLSDLLTQPFTSLHVAPDRSVQVRSNFLPTDLQTWYPSLHLACSLVYPYLDALKRGQLVVESWIHTLAEKILASLLSEPEPGSATCKDVFGVVPPGYTPRKSRLIKKSYDSPRVETWTSYVMEGLRIPINCDNLSSYTDALEWMEMAEFVLPLNLSALSLRNHNLSPRHHGLCRVTHSMFRDMSVQVPSEEIGWRCVLSSSIEQAQRRRNDPNECDEIPQHDVGILLPGKVILCHQRHVAILISRFSSSFRDEPLLDGLQPTHMDRQQNQKIWFQSCLDHLARLQIHVLVFMYKPSFLYLETSLATTFIKLLAAWAKETATEVSHTMISVPKRGENQSRQVYLVD